MQKNQISFHDHTNKPLVSTVTGSSIPFTTAAAQPNIAITRNKLTTEIRPRRTITERANASFEADDKYVKKYLFIMICSLLVSSLLLIAVGIVGSLYFKDH